MFTVNGDFGKVIFEGNTGPNGQKSSNYLSLDTQSSLNFFKRISILKTNIILNSLGLFSFGSMGRNGEVKFASLSTPKHLFKPRQSGCAWNPKGRIEMNSSTFETEAIQYQGEQCPDTFYETCFEKIFGTGVDVKNLMATPEGRVLMRQIIEEVYQGLGNSFYDLVMYAQHPTIEDSDANDWYTKNGTTDEEWGDFVEQQTTRKTAGIMTMIDLLKNQQGLENLNVLIDRDDISADGMTYTGEATDLFDKVLRAQNPAMKKASKRMVSGGSLMKSILLVSPSIFEKYESELMEEWGKGIPAGLQYQLTGNILSTLGMNSSQANVTEGVIKYKGHVVVCMDEWADFDNMTGTITHRCMAVTPGNFGLAYDVASLNQFGGLGMRMVQHLDDPWQGKIFMSTNFDVGMGLINENYIVNASKTLRPTA